jgi:predicted O-linked N-acetylglucosamine transferase (SPINDLY family)
MAALEAQAEALQNVIERDPLNAAAFNELGNVLSQLGRPDEAIAAYERAVAVDPAFAGGFYNKGLVLLDVKRPDAALEAFDAAIALKPDHARACNSRGHALSDLGRFQEAVQSYERALIHRADYADAHNGRGGALLQLEEFAAALRSFDAAIALEPGYADAHNNRGNALYQLGHIDAALASYEASLTLQPGYGGVHFNRGEMLMELARYTEALVSFDRALELKSELPYAWGERMLARAHMCDWAHYETDLAELVTRIARGEPAATPFCMLALCDSAALQKMAAREWIGRNAAPASPAPVFRHRKPSAKIRIGYFSADFCDHPVARLSAELYEMHDRSRFEVTAFSFGRNAQDSMRLRLQASFDRFIDVRNESHAAIAALSRNLQIDIAVDLTGLTKHCRPTIFAQRAAPLQAGYLGFLGTTGASYIDYLFADRTLIPADLRAHYVEKIAYLPCYQANDSRRRAAQMTPARHELGLPASGFVFCCFNASYKITSRVFAGWMRILKAAPGSLLLLYAGSAHAAQNLRREAARHGVGTNRVVFAPRLPTLEYLARYRSADLFLDTLPYNAGTTASDALWAGLPVLTHRGETFAGRMAASLLEAVGLRELITSSAAQYEEIAVMLATDPQRMGAIKRKLAANLPTAPLFDSRRHVAAVEAAYVRMYERHADDLPPADITI